MNSRLGPRVTREPGASRVPIATSLWPVSSGATSGSSARRSVERSTSMYATTRAMLRDHAVRSARPRPFCSSRSTSTPASATANDCAISGVASVLALSAIRIRHDTGIEVER